ncbi:MAG: metal ABC transporter permease, partial [Halioglobus sp.]|nr:metal ABC transporter permease [Halioglobus sp.]
MQHGNYQPDADARINWQIIRHLTPYLLESRYRVTLALVFLLLAKGAVLLIPFLLKQLVDSLDGQPSQALASALLAAIVLAYGAARFSNVFFAELR